MATFKVRRSLTVQGGFANAGKSGGFNFGSVDITSPSAASLATVVASGSVSGISDGDTLVCIPSGAMASGMVMQSACAISGGISASFLNAASADQAGSATIPLHYFATG